MCRGWCQLTSLLHKVFLPVRSVFLPALCLPPWRAAAAGGPRGTILGHLGCGDAWVLIFPYLALSPLVSGVRHMACALAALSCASNPRAGVLSSDAGLGRAQFPPRGRSHLRGLLGTRPAWPVQGVSSSVAHSVVRYSRKEARLLRGDRRWACAPASGVPEGHAEPGACAAPALSGLRGRDSAGSLQRGAARCRAWVPRRRGTPAPAASLSPGSLRGRAGAAGALPCRVVTRAGVAAAAVLEVVGTAPPCPLVVAMDHPRKEFPHVPKARSPRWSG